MKIYTIEQSEVRDGDDISEAAVVFLDKDKAQKRFIEIVDTAKKDYRDYGWEAEESNDSFMICEPGCYAQNHFSVTLGETSTEDEPEPFSVQKADQAEIVDIYLSEGRYPVAHAAKMHELTSQGMAEEEARKLLAEQPIVLEILYEEGSGLFAVESDALETDTLISPYSGKSLICQD